MADAPPFVVFRCDATPVIGTGHVMRCLTLAQALIEAGWSCAFAVGAQTRSCVPGLEAFSGDVLELDPAQGDNPVLADVLALKARWPQGCDWLVVDHYGLDVDFEFWCRSWANAIAVIDDLADRRHDCDLLVDSALDHGAENYAELVPVQARGLYGPSVALLRPQFLSARKEALARRGGPLQRVLVSLGGNAPLDLTQRIVADLSEARPNLDIDAVVGLQALDVPGDSNHVTWHVAVKDMAELMTKADASIGAGGVTSWERCCLGLPAVLLVLADNQRGNAVTLASAGAAVVAEPENAAQVLLDTDGLDVMAERAAWLCDGRGTLRVMLAMVKPESAKDGGTVRLRLAMLDDADQMFEWQSNPDTRRFARHAKPPSRGGHDAWMRKTLDDPDRMLTVIMHDGSPAGVVRLDRMGDAPSPETYEISIYVAPDKYRLGLGAAALTLARRFRPNAVIRAHVLEENEASRALFLNAGYVPNSDTWFVQSPVSPSRESS